MSSATTGRARRVDVDERLRAATYLVNPDYEAAYGVEVTSPGRSPEQWARNVFEDAPLALRWSLVFGWKSVLGLRLGPQGSTDHILGWAVQTTSEDSITLAARSALLTARKVVRLDDHHLVVATSVRFERRGAWLTWAAVLPVHHRLEPFLLMSAASRHPR